MTLGQIVENYRNEHGLSQRKLGSICDVSPGYISLLESGVNPKTGKKLIPTLPLLQKISRAMGMTVDELLSMADDIEVDINSQESEVSTPDESRKEIAMHWIIYESTKEEKLEILKELAKLL